MSKDAAMPEKMDLKSMDIGSDNRAKLKALFPSVFSETKNSKGEPVESIDFEKLKAELGAFTDLFESRKERYGMDWPGKKDCIKIIQQPSIGTLKPCVEESVNFDTTENLFIEGDNLEVLKLLQKSYYGKVKMIYIDPPYNTGKEFIYPDKFSETLDTYLAYAGLVDDEGRKFSTNTANEGRFHTKWLNMMYPRLYLARNLLKEDGVIFISIDDNEVSNLRKLCDEIFGEENFIAEIIWKKRSTPPNDKIIGAQHEYILVFCKNNGLLSLNLKSRSEEQISRYRNPDNHPKGPWASGDLMANIKGGRYVASLYFPIVNPRTKQEHYPSSNGNWRFNKERIDELIANNEIHFGEDDHGRPKLKRFLLEVKDGITWSTLWDFVPFNTIGSQEMADIFGNMATFENPKPSKLLFNILRLGSCDSDIILDFFAGSASSAHAVLDLNNQDNGNRKFIMVQLPEPCAEDSEAFKAGYKNIADIGKERISRVIKKIKEERAAKEEDSAGKVPGMDEKLPEIDLGFKVFKLDKSNFKVWDGSNTEASEEKLLEQLKAFVDHIDPDASQEDIFFELLLKAGFMLSEKTARLELAGKTVFSIADGALLICIEDEITRELIDAVAATEPMQFICLDRGFMGNDQLKANAVQTFSARNQGRDKAQQIVFRTV